MKNKLIYLTRVLNVTFYESEQLSVHLVGSQQHEE